MALGAPLPPYGFVRINFPGGPRYLALGGGGPVMTVQQVAGIRRGVRAAIQRERDAGLDIPEQEEQERVEERMRTLAGTLSQAQYDHLRQAVFTPARDTQHPEWAIATTSDPNVVALWLNTIRNNETVWIVGHGPLHTAADDSPTGPYDYATAGAPTGWRTLGDPVWNVQSARLARQPDRLREYLDPNVRQQFWSIDRYTLRWTR